MSTPYTLDLEDERDRLIEQLDKAEADKAQLQAERDEARLALSEAAQEINCAGPVVHRIRILKQDYSEQITRLQARVEELEGALTIWREAHDFMNKKAAAALVTVATLEAQLKQAVEALKAWERFAEECNQRAVEVPLWAALLNEHAVELARAAMDKAKQEAPPAATHELQGRWPDRPLGAKPELE